MSTLRNIVRRLLFAPRGWVDAALVEANVAALRVSGQPEDFLSDLERLYEIEYKYSLLSTRPFRGHPKRLRNLLNLYERKALEHVHAVGRLLDVVYTEWLLNHAITDPKMWAERRVEKLRSALETEPEKTWKRRYYLGSPVEEWYRYMPTNRRPDRIEWGNPVETMIHMFRSNIDKINKMPFTRDFLVGLGNEYKVSMESDYEKQVAEWEADPDRDEDDRPIFPGPVGLGSSYDNDHLIHYGLAAMGQIGSRVWYKSEVLPDMMEEWYKHYVFPLWIGYWKHQGIEKTRARVEDAAARVKALTRVSEFDKALLGEINYLVNVAHQTGSMLEYIGDAVGMSEKDIEIRLEELSEMDEEALEPWRQEMEAVGVDTSGIAVASV